MTQETIAPDAVMKPFAKDPFSLMTFHRVLIGTAIAACLFYGIWELVRNGEVDASGAILRGAISWLLAGCLLWYLWRIRRKK